VIYYADHGIEYRWSIQVVPFAMVEAKRRAAGVRAINVQYAARRIGRVYSASVLKFYPAQA
jgi:hypothetical protein